MVSIIVPAYNAERYVSECVESILSQSESDWELLLIDDGSTDRTGAICDRYAAKDERIRVHHRKNGGLSAARNTGLDSSRGDYITFVDSDDILHPHFLEATLEALRETGADIAGVDYRTFTNDRPYQPATTIAPPLLVSGQEAVEHALYQTPITGRGERLVSSAWGKLYKKSVWRTKRFRRGIWYEDLDIFYRVWEAATTIAFIPSALIGYRQHPGSFLHTFTPRRADVLDVTDRLLDYYRNSDRDKEFIQAAETRRFAAHCNILLLMLTHYRAAKREEGTDEIIRRCKKVIKESRGAVLRNPKARLKDRIGAIFGYLI